MTAGPARARRVFLGIALCSLVLVSCGTLRSAAETRGELHRAGFRAATVSASETNGVTTVRVRLVADEAAEKRAAEIVWRTFDYRIDRIEIDGPRGRFVHERGALEGEFGPRPAGLDGRTIGSDFARTGRTVAVVAAIVGVVMLLLVAVAIAVIVHVVRRQRRAAA